MSPLYMVLTCLDPRGRCDRRGLFAVAVVLLTLEALGFFGLMMGWFHRANLPIRLLELLLAWTGIAVSIKRLHDCGRPAWWLAAGFLVLMGWCFVLTLGLVLLYGPEAFAPHAPGFGGVLAASIAPMMAAAVWLHVVPGDSGSNAYGPAPSGHGFSNPTGPLTAGNRPTALSVGTA